MATDLTPQIGTTAAGPASAETAAGKVAAQSLDAMIKADRYLKAGQAGSMRGLGMRTRRLQLPAQVPDVGVSGDTFGDQGSFS